MQRDLHMLTLSRKSGETLMIGDEVTVTVLGVKGNQVRIGINAPKEVSVHREEIYRRIASEKEKSPDAANLTVVCWSERHPHRRRSRLLQILTKTWWMDNGSRAHQSGSAINTTFAGTGIQVNSLDNLEAPAAKQLLNAGPYYAFLWLKKRLPDWPGIARPGIPSGFSGMTANLFVSYRFQAPVHNTLLKAPVSFKGIQIQQNHSSPPFVTV